jgi:hypothetical protein
MRHAVVAAFGLLLAACAPPPKPFEHDGTNVVSLRAQQEKAEVSISSPANMPANMADRVAAALAIELQSYGVVAAVQPAAAPLKLTGAMSTRDATLGTGIEIEIEWHLTGGPDGVQGPAISKTVAQARDYAEASDRLVSRIAQQAAPRIATLMGKPTNFEIRSPGQVAAGLSVPLEPAPSPVQPTAAAGDPAATAAAAAKPAAPAAPPPPQTKMMVAPVTGAPSDGNRQLFSGMRRALGSSKIVVSDAGGPDVFVVVGSVALAPIDERTTQLSITWVLKDPSGKDVGKVEQSNPVPSAATRGTWAGFGDIVAAAAVEGVLELLEKARNVAR